ncbi:MAG: hypothetical protein DRQ55_13480, partial [Planctomycetota bacterium]
MPASPSRRDVLGGAAAALLAGGLSPGCASTAAGEAAARPGAAPVSDESSDPPPARPHTGSLIVSTWGFGQQANAAAWEALAAGVAHPVHAAEAGVSLIESDPDNASVGYGGNPNADGVVELDACVMRGDSLACGGVAALRNTLHPVSVARRVMERTIHVLLVGDGAMAFAREQGFEAQEMLTERSRAAYARWLEQGGRPPPEQDHDTIGQIVLHEGRFGV